MRRHLSYANVMSTVAVVLAVAGGSTAVAISAKKAPKNSVTSKSIRNRSVTAKDLAKGAVTAKAIRDGHVTASELAGVRVEYRPGVGVATLYCGAGERLLSGGALTTNGIRALGPTDDGNGWRSLSAPGQQSTAVLCLKPTPGP